MVISVSTQHVEGLTSFNTNNCVKFSGEKK